MHPSEPHPSSPYWTLVLRDAYSLSEASGGDPDANEEAEARQRREAEERAARAAEELIRS